MKLTKKKAIEITREELWPWLAETGTEFKEDWPGWEKYGRMWADCPLCECSNGICGVCPYYEKFGHCNKPGTPFWKWSCAETPEERKQYARLFLEQLKEL